MDKKKKKGRCIILVYDTEIKNAIPNKKIPPVEGIKYCKGWRDFTGMGVAVVCAYDYDTDGFRVFCDDNLKEFQELVMGTDVVVGYNNQIFDDPLMEAHGVRIPDEMSYDLYKEIYKAHGYKPSERVGGLKLGDVARVNLNGMDKSDDGALAPINWQWGLVGTVIDYCMQDVLLTRDLLDLVIKGRLVSPKTRRILRVKPPRKVMR